MRVRVDVLAADARSPAPTMAPCPNATRQRAARMGRIESWWDVEIDRFEELVDMLRRLGSDGAVVELANDGVRIWITQGDTP